MPVKATFLRAFQLLLIALTALWMGACNKQQPGRWCQGDGICIEPDGQRVLPDGRPECELDNSCVDATTDDDPTDGGGPDGGDTITPDNDIITDQDGDGDGGGDVPPADCQACEVTGADSDGDCIPDALEDFNSNSTVDAWVDDGDGCVEGIDDTPGETDPNNPDTDGDGILDGCEDANQNGQWDPGETFAFAGGTDSDCDGIPDGVEDANQNGIFELSLGETSSLNSDTDSDGLPDGVEDRDGDGEVDPWQDLNDNGLLDAGDVPGESDPTSRDTDGDGILDSREDLDADGECDDTESCAYIADTDNDGLLDGQEDRNGNGRKNTGETDARNPDTDGDGLPDGVEDANRDGEWSQGIETNPLLADTDGDGIADGTEDRNLNGVVDGLDDLNSNGCLDAGETQGESDPRVPDSDGDGIGDAIEDANRDGLCDVSVATDGDGQDYLVFIETCAAQEDTDCDGLTDGQEDVDLNGSFVLGELNPRRKDTDLDGLLDGCPLGTVDTSICEDIDNDGERDFNETDPHFVDTDADGLTDGCEVFFEGGATDPLSLDTDGDGYPDGEEDGNHNCTFESGVENCDSFGNCRLETDPRVADDPPPPGTKGDSEYQVCATTNLKKLTFAENACETHDYRVAFEVEQVAGGVCNNNNDCDPGLVCDEGTCSAFYVVEPFGIDNDSNGFDPNNECDEFMGHVFQSPVGVGIDAGTGELLNRDIYGFVLSQEYSGDLNVDDFLDTLRNTLRTRDPIRDVEALPALAAAPAHDSLSPPRAGNFRIDRATRSFKLEFASARPPVAVRNDLLEDDLLGGAVSLVGTGGAAMPPSIDAVHGIPNCSVTDPHCFRNYMLFVTAVHRKDQQGESGDEGVLHIMMALTPDDSTDGGERVRIFNERLARVEDLTGGSAFARYAAETGRICENRPQKAAVADMLWVVDDSASMQAVIEKLQQASLDAKAVLTANSNIVDFRVGMTTTNPSRNARAVCPEADNSTCTAVGTNCYDATLGCLNPCATDTSGDGACIAAASFEDALWDDISGGGGGGVGDGAYHMPGGGGTFYYEDSEYLDCQGFPRGLNACPSGSAEFAPFFDGGSRKRLTHHAGLLSSSDDACATALLDLTWDGEASDMDCTINPDMCCERLTETCADGPTVLASQMCDLVRAMGGKHEPGSSDANTSARYHSGPEQGSRSARRLIQSMLPALPRDYAGSGACTTSDDCADFENCFIAPGQSSGECGVRHRHLRLDCDTGPECQPCNPMTEDCPAQVPLVTIFLSDEEDAFFKDDCQQSGGLVDDNQLPEQCYWRDGDATTTESCNPCENAVACADDGDCPGTACGTDGICECDPLSYCTSAGFSFDGPAGYGPDMTLRQNLAGQVIFSYALADGDAPQCTLDAQGVGGCSAADTACQVSYLQSLQLTSCSGDPCGQQSFTNQESCEAFVDTFAQKACRWDSGSGCVADCADCVSTDCTTFADQTSCEAAEETLTQPLCEWFAGATLCRSTCTMTTGDVTALGAGDKYTLAKAACLSDARCAWDPGRVTGTDAIEVAPGCVAARPMNDCQACKRLARELDAVQGTSVDPYLALGACEDGRPCNSAADCVSGACIAVNHGACTDDGSPCAADGDCVSGTCSRGLIGFDSVGPVYAIVREKGIPGHGNFDPDFPEDRCVGSGNPDLFKVTFGLGDGLAYSNIAAATLGRTQDVCANSYQDFLSLVLTDIAALSAPYPLSAAPIAATIKVGIARPDDGCIPPTDGSTDSCTYSYIEVPRSRTQGFFYDATNQTIAFKSDPIAGQCVDDGGCIRCGDEAACSGLYACTGGGGSCTAADIRSAEILYARDKAEVPRENDTIYISYRYWEPVPCLERCGDGQQCLPILCTGEEDLVSCPGGSDLECPEDFSCIAGTCECVVGEIIHQCTETSECPTCYTYNTSTGECDPPADACGCTPDEGIRCVQGNPASCPSGMKCGEDCLCQPIDGCGGVFPLDGSSAACEAGLLCCAEWDAARDACEAIADQATCDDNPPAEVCTALGLDNSTVVTIDYDADCFAAGKTECQCAQPCGWNPDGYCEYLNPTCCASDESPSCFSNESGGSQLYCTAVCECTSCPADNPGCLPAEEVPGCQAFYECTEVGISGSCECVREVP